MSATQTIMMCVIDFTKDRPYIVDGLGSYETEEEFLTAVRVKVREIRARYEFELCAKYIENDKLEPMDPHWDGEGE